jgi:hypothetical protein
MQYLYKQFMPIVCMTEMVWKCFRCNLSFKDDQIAEMHKEISAHSVTKVKTIVA